MSPPAISAVPERREMAKLCRAGNWSKAIRILDALIAHSSTADDIWNRAYCYSQLELHKHVVRDCDRALQMDPDLLKAYILKGRALSSLGKEDDALHVWEKGHEIGLQQPADLMHLLDLEELLATSRQKTAPAPEACSDISNDSCSSETAAFPNNQSHLAGSNGNYMDVNGTSNGNHVDERENKVEPENFTELKECSNEELMIRKQGEAKSGNLDVKGSSHGNHTKAKASEAKAEIFSNLNESSNGNYTKFKESEIKTKSTDHRKLNKVSDSSSIQRKAKENMLNQLYAAVPSKNISINLDMRLSRGIEKVNEGRYDQAVSIFDQILRDNPASPEAFIGRGTAYAFQKELDSAISDFSKAICSLPSSGEAWKRRGQARAAMGEYKEAIGDLTKALEFEPKSSDILHERGIVNFKFKDYIVAVDDLTLCVTLDKDNNSAYSYLGLALAAIGEYAKAEECHMKAVELDPNFLDGWIHRTQFYQELANHENAFKCLERVLAIDKGCPKAYHLSGLLHHGMGAHRAALKELNVGLSIESSNIECLYLRASCYHAIGEYGDAVKDYDAVLEVELDSMDKFVLQCLAFYQKEIALYTASKINSEFCWFDIDGDVDPFFKEYWCKRLHPKNVAETVFRQPPLRESPRRGRISKEDLNFTKQKLNILKAADLIGENIQYHCPGFLPNRRQYRMAGLAAIQVAQRVSKAWRSLHLDWKMPNKSWKKPRRKEKIVLPVQIRGGGSCSTSSITEPSKTFINAEDKMSSQRYLLSWQEVYNIAVKWRQISEPCDPVVWINKLGKEFNSGFGSHTPMLLGQAKVVRYFPNYSRAFDAAKSIIIEKKYAHNAKDAVIDLSNTDTLESIKDARSCSDLHKIVGEDFWLATSCCSLAFEGKLLNGTRITVQKMEEKGFDFAIRTPCTPARWDEYETEMEMAWQALCTSYCGEVYGSTDTKLLEPVHDAILRMSYYWYNFMPLSRGSAVVGYIVMLGLFLATNTRVLAKIPQGMQVDWEAILSSHCETFVDRVKPWLCSSLKFDSSWRSLPDVTTTFSTTGSVVSALSAYSN